MLCSRADFPLLTGTFAGLRKLFYPCALRDLAGLPIIAVDMNIDFRENVVDLYQLTNLRGVFQPLDADDAIPPAAFVLISFLSSEARRSHRPLRRVR